jgi:hypothetical protein
MFRALGEVFGAATNTRNAKQSRRMIYRAFIALGTMLVGTTFPFVMFLFNLKPIYIIVSCILIGSV